MQDQTDRVQNTFKIEQRKNSLGYGANKRIGFASALTLAKLGYKVWLGSRNQAWGQIAIVSPISSLTAIEKSPFFDNPLLQSLILLTKLNLCLLTHTYHFLFF
jgi:hypothetical protein